MPRIPKSVLLPIVGALLLASSTSHALEFCVQDVKGLELALRYAANNGESDTVLLRSGDYFLPGIAILATDAESIEIAGGYNPGCRSQSSNVTATRLISTNPGNPLLNLGGNLPSATLSNITLDDGIVQLSPLSALRVSALTMDTTDSNNDGRPDWFLDQNGDGEHDFAVDTDLDGVIDALDVFPNDPKVAFDTDGDGTGDALDTDDDNDGVSDTEEILAGTNPYDANDGPLPSGLSPALIRAAFCSKNPKPSGC